MGIDASHLSQFNSTGTQNYLYYLVKELACLDTKNLYEIYFKSEPSSAFFTQMVSGNSNFTFRYIKNRLSWTQVGLALECLRQPPDVLLAPWQTMPIFHSPKTKIVSVIHDFAYKPLRFGPTYFTCMFSNRVIAVSADTKKQILTRRLAREPKITVIYEGIDTLVFAQSLKDEVERVRTKYSLPQDYILFVGYVVPRKNLENMLTAFAKHTAEISFIVGGSISAQSAAVTNLPEKLGIQNRVKFLGRVAQADLPALYSGATFFAYVSKTEGFGLPVLEAMSCGTPVLTSTAGALPEVAGTAAKMVVPGDVAAIGHAMSELATDAGLRQQLVAQGFENVKRFSWQKTAEKVLQVLEECRTDA